MASLFRRPVLATHEIPAYASAVKDGRVCTLYEAAAKLGTNAHVVRALMCRGVIRGTQVMKDAPWQIPGEDLDSPAVQEAVAAHRAGRLRPYRLEDRIGDPMLPGI